MTYTRLHSASPQNVGGIDALLQSAVKALCNTVLLWSIANGVLPSDAMFVTESLKGLGHVFSALVIAQSANSTFQNVLSPSLERFERAKRLIFRPHGDYNAVALAVVDEGHPVAHS